LEAKFSLEFATAAPLLRRRLGLAEFADDFVTSPALIALMAKVEAEVTDVYDPDYPVAAHEAYVTIELDDGTQLRTPAVRAATGHADIPLPTAKIWDKFLDCAGSAGLAEAGARSLFDAAQRVDALADATSLAIGH